MQRLAVFAGVLGAIAAGVASYAELQAVLHQTQRHKTFESLVNSQTVKQERKSWPLTLAYTPERAIQTFRRLPENAQRDAFGGLTGEQRLDLLAKLKCEPLLPGSRVAPDSSDRAGSYDAILRNLSQVYAIFPPGAAMEDDPFACMPDSGDPPASTVDRDGIKTIHWTKDLEVESIDTPNGNSIYPTPPPSRWLYLLVATLPLFGFVLPWGLVRSIGWVATGFVAGPK